jgi:anti-sigma factor (TIGR02949 family)
MKQDVMGCEEALRLLVEYLDRELRPDAQARVEQHLETCRSCFSRAEFERRLKVQLAELKELPVEPAFEERMRGLLRGFAAARDDKIS